MLNGLGFAAVGPYSAKRGMAAPAANIPTAILFRNAADNFKLSFLPAFRFDSSCASCNGSGMRRLSNCERSKVMPPSFLRLQPDLDKSADGFRAGERLFLFFNPIIDHFEVRILPAHADLKAASRCRGATSLFWGTLN